MFQQAAGLPRLEAKWTVREGEGAFFETEEEWRTLHPFCERSDPFADWDYVRAWWETFGRTRGRDVTVLRVLDDGGQTCAIVPFLVCRLNALSLGPNMAMPFGHNGTVGPADMSEMPLYLVRPGREAEATAALFEFVQSLLAKKGCDGALLRLTFADVLQHADRFSEIRGASVRVRPRDGKALAALPDNWRAYMKVLTKSMRDNTKYYPKLLERNGHAWDVALVHEESDLPEAVQTVVRLHRARAATNIGPKHDNHLPTSREAKFLETIVMQAASKGGAMVAILRIDGSIAAAQVFFIQKPRLSVYYSGFDPVWSKFSPITVLQTAVFKRLHEEGYREIDFFLEQAPWKLRWGAEVQGPAAEVFVCSKRPHALARLTVWSVGRALKRTLQSLDKNRRSLLGLARRRLKI